MRSTIIILTALIAALSLTSCSSMPAAATQVRFADDLEGVVVVEQPVLERDDGDRLRVAVPIQNVSGEDIELMVRVEFLDSLGNRYNDDTPRQVMLLPRGSTRDFRAASMMAKADDFIATIWWNR